MKLFSINHNQKWHNWFAWHPVWAQSQTTHGFACKELVWLETVERRAVFSAMDGSFGFYEYAKIRK